MVESGLMVKGALYKYRIFAITVPKQQVNGSTYSIFINLLYLLMICKHHPHTRAKTHTHTVNMLKQPSL